MKKKIRIVLSKYIERKEYIGTHTNINIQLMTLINGDMLHATMNAGSQ